MTSPPSYTMIVLKSGGKYLVPGKSQPTPVISTGEDRAMAWYTRNEPFPLPFSVITYANYGDAWDEPNYQNNFFECEFTSADQLQQVDTGY